MSLKFILMGMRNPMKLEAENRYNFSQEETVSIAGWGYTGVGIQGAKKVTEEVATIILVRYVNNIN